jgi:hemophore-related protein
MSFFVRSAGFAAVIGAVMLGTAATAMADDPPQPNCTAADLAGVMSGVTTATSVYLFTHPDVNAFFTGLNGLSRDEMRDRVQAYFDANPQAGAELRAIRRPSVEFRDRCDVPLFR